MLLELLLQPVCLPCAAAFQSVSGSAGAPSQAEPICCQSGQSGEPQAFQSVAGAALFANLVIPWSGVPTQASMVSGQANEGLAC